MGGGADGSARWLTTSVRGRYFVRVTAARSMATNMTKSREFIVQNIGKVSCRGGSLPGVLRGCSRPRRVLVAD